MPKYKTAKQLGILPEEHKALVAFVQSPSLGRIVSVNGHAHFYEQGFVESENVAEKTECGTAGCVAGFVFAHAIHVQGKRSLRGERTASNYIEAASEDLWDEEKGTHLPTIPLLNDLYTEGMSYKLETARKIVSKMLKTGRVRWPATDDGHPVEADC